MIWVDSVACVLMGAGLLGLGASELVGAPAAAVALSFGAELTVGVRPRVPPSARGPESPPPRMIRGSEPTVGMLATRRLPHRVVVVVLRTSRGFSSLSYARLAAIWLAFS
jgi:hypothetical protein